MDVRLTSEQRQLRDAAASLADDLGPGSVLDLADDDRVARLEKAVAETGWRTLRSDGASGVELALVVEEFARGLVDVPLLGPLLADDLSTAGAGAVADPDPDPDADPDPALTRTIAVGATATDARGLNSALTLRGNQVLAGRLGEVVTGVDLTRRRADLLDPLEPVGELSADRAEQWLALATVVTAADMLGAARGAHALAVDYAKVRKQYGKTIGSFQEVAHLLAEGLALIEGSVSVLRHAAWAVDELPAAQALQAARIAKIYCGRAAQTVCETAIQVHGGIGNTWECMAHVFLRRVLTAGELFPARLEEIDLGFL
jgi:hypothetical protein